MGRYPFFVIVLCGAFLPRVLCLLHGISTIDCDTMLPEHGGEPQQSTPPYIIALSSDKYAPGNEIQVTLKGIAEQGFQEFNLQARELEGDTPVGSFKITDSNTQALACYNYSNSAVSHTNSEVKYEVTTTWIATSDIKSIQFRATVVKDSENFWTGVHSKSVTPKLSRSAKVTERRNRKKGSRILIEMDCTKKGGTYSTSSGCILIPGSSQVGSVVQIGSSGSSKTSSIGQVGVIYAGGKTSGCAPGRDGVYSKYGCKDNTISQNTGLSYGQSVSSGNDIIKPKPIPESNPYPPERHTFPLSGDRIPSSNIDNHKIPLVVKKVNPCDQSSSSYNIVICRRIHSSATQNNPVNGQGESSSSVVSSACGQGTSYDSNPCHQGSQNSSVSSGNACNQSSSNCTNGKPVFTRDTSHALRRKNYNRQDRTSLESTPPGNPDTTSLESTPPGNPESPLDDQMNSAAKQSSPGLLLLFSILSTFAISSSLVHKWFI
ncbi:uncharacterized protein LOC102451418 [Pelodiscus sinensis]|uniref:uncharacterized protein LOC102451418 n=1 Tax=Pelodiscus sinensis TaxID=13735 RepID=UPI003F6AACFD